MLGYRTPRRLVILFLLFFFLYCFFLSDRPSQNQETISKLNEKKWGWPLKKRTAQKCSWWGFIWMVTPLNFVLKFESSKWIAFCDSTTWMVTPHDCSLQISKGGAVMRALASHQCGPGSNPGVDAICVEFIVGSLPWSKRFFSGYPGFPVSLKTNTSKFQFARAPWVKKWQFPKLQKNTCLVHNWVSEGLSCRDVLFLVLYCILLYYVMYCVVLYCIVFVSIIVLYLFFAVIFRRK